MIFFTRAIIFTSRNDCFRSILVSPSLSSQKMYHSKNIKFKSVRGTRNWTGTTENTKGRREERLHPFPTSSFFPCLELHFHRVQLRHLQLSRWQPCPCLYYHYSSPANFLVKVTWAEFKSELFLTAFKERIVISVHNSTERGFTRGQSRGHSLLLAAVQKMRKEIHAAPHETFYEAVPTTALVQRVQLPLEPSSKKLSPPIAKV